MAQPQKGVKAKCSTAAFSKLFTFREVGMQVPLVTMSRPSQRTAAPPPCLPLYIKDSLKEDRDFDWWLRPTCEAAARMTVLL
jgi:hypothetical protein